MKPIKRKNGNITRYGFALGYVQIKGDVRLEQISSNGTLRVSWDKGWSREFFSTMKPARAKFSEKVREERMRTHEF